MTKKYVFILMTLRKTISKMCKFQTPMFLSIEYMYSEVYMYIMIYNYIYMHEMYIYMYIKCICI